MRLTRLSVALAAGFALCAAVPSHAGTLDRIKQDAKIRLGYRADARPFSYSDASGNPAGYSVALCHEVVDALKKSLGLADLPVETVKIDAPQSRSTSRCRSSPVVSVRCCIAAPPSG